MKKIFKIILLSSLFLSACGQTEKRPENSQAPEQGSSEITTPEEAPTFLAE